MLSYKLKHNGAVHIAGQAAVEAGENVVSETILKGIVKTHEKVTDEVIEQSFDDFDIDAQPPLKFNEEVPSPR